MVNIYSEFAAAADKFKDRVCVSFEGQDFSYDTIHAGAKRLAAKLREIAPGDSESEIDIGLFSPNFPGFLVGYYGTMAADKVTVPINFLFNQNEIMTIGMHAGIRIIVAAGPLYEKACEMAKALPITVLRAEDFLSADPVPEIPAPTRADGDTAVLMYTSGTTGTPKGVELTHSNIVENYRDTVTVYDFTQDHTFICVLPLFHSFGMTTMMVLSNMIGARLVLVPQFLPAKLAEYFNTYSRGLFFGVAPMYQILGQLAKAKGLKYANLELCVSGAAALPMDVKDSFEAATGVTIYQGYGLSEASPAVSLNLPGKHKPGTIGQTIDNVEIQIWDEEGKKLPNGEIGEIVVKGKNVMKGYYKNPQVTAETITPEGWLHTGDLGFLDDDGYTTIVGRKKELIICAGENIYPLEIEDVLMRHPAVAEAAVIGIPHPKKGEEPKAYLTLQPDAKVEIGELRNHCKEHLAAYKVPAEFEIREELPKNATGKILKRVLEEEIKGKT
jgi:long-chain acyl-CoA synthetase